MISSHGGQYFRLWLILLECLNMKTALLSTLLLTALPLSAQHGPHVHQHGKQTEHSSYASMTDRTIKALSEQQIADIQAGKGMALALPAELNGYPGPAHTLELAERLALTAEQKSQTEQLYSEMQTEAKALGRRFIASEEKLDRLFREKRATASAVAHGVEEAALAQGRLRNAHLQYHLKMIEVLTPSQVAAYNRLRGYARD